MERTCKTTCSCCELPTLWLWEILTEHTVSMFSWAHNVAIPTGMGSSIKTYNRSICNILNWLLAILIIDSFTVQKLIIVLDFSEQKTVLFFHSLFNSINCQQLRWDKAPAWFLLLFTLISIVSYMKEVKDYRHHYCKTFKCSLTFNFTLIVETSIEK